MALCVSSRFSQQPDAKTFRLIRQNCHLTRSGYKQRAGRGTLLGMKHTRLCRLRHPIGLLAALASTWGCSPPPAANSTTPAQSPTAQSPADQPPAAAVPAASASAPAPQPPPQATPMRLTDEAFRMAAYEGRLEAVREGLQAGNNVNAADAQRQLTPLHMAAFNGHTDVIRLLLEHGATLDARDVEGKTPLLHACTGPFPRAVEILLDAGADINAAESTEAFTPLMMAAGLGETEVVKVLLARNANTELLDNDGDSALTHAQNEGHSEIVQLLQKP